MNQTGFFTGPMVIEFRGGGATHAQLVIQEEAVFGLNVGGAYAGSSSSTLPRNTWVYVELGLSVASANGTYEVRVNGTSQDYIAGTGDTQNGAATTVDQIKIIGIGGSGVQHKIYVGDMYVTYGDELAWKGDSRVDRLLLTADSTPQEWTPSTGNAWERLNAGDGYIASSTDEATSLFTSATLTHAPDTIHGVCARSILLKDSAGTRAATSVVRSGSTEAEATPLTLAETSAALTQVLKVDPATGSAWTLSAVNALKTGVRVKT